MEDVAPRPWASLIVDQNACAILEQLKPLVSCDIQFDFCPCFSNR